MLANVSHGFRTPLTSLQGFDTLLDKGDALTPEKRKGYVEIAARQSQRLSVLVEELFELAKLDALEAVPNKEMFSPVELVSDIVQKFQLKARGKGLRIEREFTADLPFVEGDIGMIERVFENLIGNALQHTPKGEVISLSLHHTKYKREDPRPVSRTWTRDPLSSILPGRKRPFRRIGERTLKILFSPCSFCTINFKFLTPSHNFLHKTEKIG